MKISEVKKRIGTAVKFTNAKYHIDSGDYILSGCILRKDEHGQFYYLAELNDIHQRKCTLIVRLEEII